MKLKTYFRICQLATLWIFLISTNNCKKMEEPSTNVQTVLPEKLIVSPDIYTDEMSTTTGWTVPLGTLELNTSEYISGSSSLKLTSPNGSAAVIYKEITMNLSADSEVSFYLWAYPHTDPSKTFASGCIHIIAGDDASFTNSFISYSYNNQIVQGKWNKIKVNVHANRWQVLTGSPDWSNINYIKIRLYPASGQIAICSFDLIGAGRVEKPAIIIKFDDCNSSDYNYAYPLLKSKNMVATCFIVSDFIDTSPTLLSSAQLIELNNNGWSIGNHSKTHPKMLTLTELEVYDEFENCRIFLDGLGLTKSSRYIMVPGGATSSTISAALATFGARTVILSNTEETTKYETDFPLNIKLFAVHNTVTLDEVKAWVDLAILKKEVMVLQLHELVNETGPDFQWLVSQFSGLLDYIESKGLQTLTIDEYYRLYYGPITVNHK